LYVPQGICIGDDGSVISSVAPRLD
jgi:hypothetical protein